MLSAREDAEMTTNPRVTFYIFNASQEQLPSSIRVQSVTRSGCHLPRHLYMADLAVSASLQNNLF